MLLHSSLAFKYGQQANCHLAHAGMLTMAHKPYSCVLTCSRVICSKPKYCPPLWRFSVKCLVWLQAELNEELALKRATISLLEATVTNLESDLHEQTEVWQGAPESLEELFKIDKASLEDQLAAVTAEGCFPSCWPFE